MCKIYEFPKAMVLPQYLENRLKESAKDYVKTLNDIMQYFENERFNDEDLMELMDIVLATYLKAIEEVVDDI